MTDDHVNPETPWPHLNTLDSATSVAGRVLREQLDFGPAFVCQPDRWLDPALEIVVRRTVENRGCR